MEKITAIRASSWQKAARRMAEKPGLRLLGTCLGTAALGFLLAGGSLLGATMPFAVCLIAAAASPLRALPALLGGSLGCLFFLGPGNSLEQLATGVLVFSAVCIVDNAELDGAPWLMPLLAAVLSGLVGLLFLAQARFEPEPVALYCERLAVTALSSWAYARAGAARSRSCLLYMLMCLLSGCAALALPGGITLGQILAVAVGAAAAGTPGALLLGGAAGLAVDMAAAPPVSLTALLCFAGLTASAFPVPNRPLRSLVYLAAVLAGVLFTGGQTPELVPAAALGCCLSLLIPPEVLPARDGSGNARLRLERAAAALAEAEELLDVPEPPPDPKASGVFDRASDQVCGSCALWSQCWQRRSTETYRALCTVAQPMLERGEARREDFPESFAERCSHLDELTAALNRELERRAGRRQYRSRLQECRTALTGQLGGMEALLRRTAASLSPRSVPEARFTPELGAKTVGKSAVSGDRAAWFQTEGGMYYVLLCDGMGTGEEASEESRRAIRLLAGLLQAGQEPRRALESLNGLYVLRGDGVFSTVDLLSVNLATGQAVLYKWGASPSYLRSGQETRKLGTAALPPGFGVGEAHKAEAFRLSLREGEMLVLLSDGAGGEEAGRRVAAWGDGAPGALAAALVEESQADGEDDRTAVALRLRRRPLGLR